MEAKKINNELLFDPNQCPVIRYVKELEKQKDEYETFDNLHIVDGTSSKCSRKL